MVLQKNVKIKNWVLVALEFRGRNIYQNQLEITFFWQFEDLELFSELFSKLFTKLFSISGKKSS
jgi:hypothetical protein